MQAKHDAMEKEKESLSKSDAVGLKDREAELVKEMKRQQGIIDSKNSALQGKQEQYREEEDKQKKRRRPQIRKKKEKFVIFLKRCRQRRIAWLLRNTAFFKRNVRNIWKKQLHLIHMKNNFLM